ncbi:periplasmic nitrate reductase chaperone NapD [Pasteurella testudinis DSM 23072]|uniref:Chaperone NapD n=1 Tax=Pasteurella testudinis DSM 23072 TaxID=1122938 RepID=A0A1W1UEW4_9PAST|nr:chaperone NapD [Pasteurella testudinis]SMB79600.1 periplasmic nitrate reductase chaperone NapD [Pasteurella testudinis DSM 23072]SUB50706.1 protein NapD [Pasteurella testudinis]
MNTAVHTKEVTSKETAANTNIDNASEWHVCGVVVQCRPDDISAVKTALQQMEYTDITAVDQSAGKLVVVMESHHQGVLLDRMEAARNIKGVLALSLVYHQQAQD